MLIYRIIFLFLFIVQIQGTAYCATESVRLSFSPIEPPHIEIVKPSVSRGVKIVTSDAFVEIAGKITNASIVPKVTVNDNSVEVSKDGNFTVRIPIVSGDNKVTVFASFGKDLSSNQTFVVHKNPILNQAMDTIVSKGKYVALIIGIDNYSNIEKLKTAVNDATSIEKILREQYGFETKLLVDREATRDGILKEFNNLRKTLHPKDNLMIYYAGHGEYIKDADAAYWLPIDAEPDDNTKWLESKSITDQLKLISSQHVLIIADSCYSGTLTRKSNTDLRGQDTRNNYLKKLLSKQARVLISSGGNEPVADQGSNGHSVFADSLISALSSSEKSAFTAEELYLLDIKESVAGRAEQVPEYKIIRNSGHDGGDFVFIRKFQ